VIHQAVTVAVPHVTCIAIHKNVTTVPSSNGSFAVACYFRDDDMQGDATCSTLMLEKRQDRQMDRHQMAALCLLLWLWSLYYITTIMLHYYNRFTALCVGLPR